VSLPFEMQDTQSGTCLRRTSDAVGPVGLRSVLGQVFPEATQRNRHVIAVSSLRLSGRFAVAGNGTALYKTGVGAALVGFDGWAGSGEEWVDGRAEYHREPYPFRLTTHAFAVASVI